MRPNFVPMPIQIEQNEEDTGNNNRNKSSCKRFTDWCVHWKTNSGLCFGAAVCCFPVQRSKQKKMLCERPPPSNGCREQEHFKRWIESVRWMHACGMAIVVVAVVADQLQCLGRMRRKCASIIMYLSSTNRELIPANLIHEIIIIYKFDVNVCRGYGLIIITIMHLLTIPNWSQWTQCALDALQRSLFRSNATNVRAAIVFLQFTSMFMLPASIHRK